VSKDEFVYSIEKPLQLQMELKQILGNESMNIINPIEIEERILDIQIRK
jgi:hypothetical protein